MTTEIIAHPPLAAMVAENDHLYRASAEASDAVSAIEYAARVEIAANPVIVTLTRIKPDGEAVTREVPFIAGEPKGEYEDTLMALAVVSAAGRARDGEPLTELKAEMVLRLDEARRVSKERADAIRAKVYADMGYEAALAARDKAYEVADAHAEQLQGTPIRTMADAVAAIQFIRDTNADWDGLGDRALAFLREKAA